MSNERRIKILFLSRAELCSILGGDHNIRWPQVPKDAFVWDVHENWERGGLDVLVHSADFEPVPFGERPARLDNEPVVIEKRGSLGWIDPKVTLPEVGKTVIVSYPGRIGKPVVMLAMLRESNDWYMMQEGWVQENVTHWMPLPIAPERVGSEGSQE